MGIIIEDITKSYKDRTALKGINLSIPEGSLYGLIGPDGAGKTTLFRILTTLLLPDAGSASVAGFDIVKDYKMIRKHVGYMPGRFSLYEDLTVEENLTFFATIFGTTISENYELIKDIYFQIEPFKNRRAGALSGGMKQKLALSCALIHRPRVLFLDEPTTGVDPVSRKEFWEMLIRLKKKGITILVSTAYMEEAKMCDTIALIQDGNILDINTPEGLVNDFDKTIYGIKNRVDTYKLIQDLEKTEMSYSVVPFGDTIHFVPANTDFAISELRAYLEQKGHQHIEIQPIAPTVEDVFMDYSKQESEL